ncbi:MAG: PDGLE domain-containing protein [Desulfuromonadales bacterium]|nr:PDGLE domain-containing protein [Desulfuromonadales bacterium]NVN93206.1 PDGLE domain-containing protein [Desulfuromonadales bacterium]
MSTGISTVKKLWLGLAVLALLSPLGLILPDRFKAGSAWGEWGPDEMEKMLGYVPQGMKKLAELWSAPLPDYAFKGWDKQGLGMQSIAYIASAIMGIAVIVAVTMLLGKIVTKDQE